VKCQKLAYIAASFQSAHAEQRIVCIRKGARITNSSPLLHLQPQFYDATKPTFCHVAAIQNHQLSCCHNPIVTLSTSGNKRRLLPWKNKQTSPTYRVCKHTDNTSYLSLSVVFYRLLSTSKHNSWHFVTLPFIMWKQDNWVTMTWLKHVATVTASIG